MLELDKIVVDKQVIVICQTLQSQINNIYILFLSDKDTINYQITALMC